MEKTVDPKTVKTIEQLEAEFNKVFLLEDKGVIRLMTAVVIANQMNLDPVWMLLVAPSSGGKTEIIQAMSGLEIMHAISDLTVNTFASGMQRTGKETSLLFKINGGIMAFKDFTSILSKNKEARAEIMKQLREIYDGEYVKRTGTGDDIVWKGKVGAIAGATEVVYSHLSDFAAMGDRFIMYSMEQPDRLEVARRALNNANSIIEKRQHLKNCCTTFLNHIIETVDEDDIQLTKETEEKLLEVADFATRVRSAVMTDFKTGLIDFVPAEEMPMRVTQQLYTIARAFIAMKKGAVPNGEVQGVLSELEEKILYKTAFDSIPKARRLALNALAKFRGGVSSAGLATFLNLPTPSVTKYLYQINALGVCAREKKGGSQGDHWKIKEEYRELVARLGNVKVVDGVLLSNEPDEDGGNEWDEVDKHMAEKESFDPIFKEFKDPTQLGL